MLNDVDQNEVSRPGAEALFDKLKKWVKTDYNSKGQTD